MINWIQNRFFRNLKWWDSIRSRICVLKGEILVNGRLSAQKIKNGTLMALYNLENLNIMVERGLMCEWRFMLLVFFEFI